METLTKPEYDLLLEQDNYYRNRWNYFSIVTEWINYLNPDTVLEAGPYRQPICKNCDTIDINNTFNPTFCFDLGITPWPIDKKYDLFIALQVWEHVKNPIGAFKEVKRISKNAIFSLPFEWKNCGSLCHENITFSKIHSWFNFEDFSKCVIVPPVKTKRIVFLFEF